MTSRTFGCFDKGTGTFTKTAVITKRVTFDQEPGLHEVGQVTLQPDGTATVSVPYYFDNPDMPPVYTCPGAQQPWTQGTTMSNVRATLAQSDAAGSSSPVLATLSIPGQAHA